VKKKKQNTARCAERKYSLYRIKDSANSARIPAEANGGRHILKKEKSEPNTNTYVLIAAESLPTTARMQTTAAGSVLLRRDGQRCNMDGKLYSRIKEYNTVLAVIREMGLAGITTDKDFGIICLSLAEKYGLSSCSIFAGIDLITARTDGNI
jgi:hypothetical protein